MILNPQIMEMHSLKDYASLVDHNSLPLQEGGSLIVLKNIHLAPIGGTEVFGCDRVMLYDTSAQIEVFWGRSETRDYCATMSCYQAQDLGLAKSRNTLYIRSTPRLFFPFVCNIKKFDDKPISNNLSLLQRMQIAWDRSQLQVAFGK